MKMNAKWKKEMSGVIYPVQEKELERDWGSLELRDEEDRKMVSQHLAEIYNLYCGGGIVLPTRGNKKEDSKRAVRYLAETLLGDDWTCEEYC